MSDYGSAGANAAGAAVGGVFLLLYVALIVALIIALWKIFEKADKPGWASIIPVYNCWVLYDILWPGKALLYFILAFIPFVNVIIGIMAMLRLAKAFGKSVIFALGLIFLGPIFLLILGFGDSTYQPEQL